MAEFGIDTSSYPKPIAGKGLLDQVKDYQSIESSKLTIDKQKLDQVNQGYDYLIREVRAATDPDDMRKKALQALRLKLIKPDMYATYVSSIPNDPDKFKTFKEEQLGKFLDTQAAINFHHGPQPSLVNTGNALEPHIINQRTQSIYPAGGQPIPAQLPPTQTEVDPNTGQSRVRGVQPSFNPDGSMRGAPMPKARPALPVAPPVGPQMAPEGKINNSAIPGLSSNFGGNVLSAVAEKPTFNDRFSAAQQSPNIAPAPMFEEGKKMLVGDQQEASQRMMRIKPAAQALELMQKPGMLSGPLSEGFTQAAAALKTFGLIPSEMNDPTAIRQEVAKKLAQYVSGNPVGQRSDSAQILAEASSPNPKTQTLQALVKLTKDAIILDRVQAAMPNAFSDKDLSKYGKHKATFPQNIDERAFGLDFEKDRGTTLVDSMAAKLKKNPKDTEANKFFRSLATAKEQGFYE